MISNAIVNKLMTNYLEFIEIKEDKTNSLLKFNEEINSDINMLKYKKASLMYTNQAIARDMTKIRRKKEEYKKMEEDYISMANSINNFITQYCGLNENYNDNSSEAINKDDSTTSVADVLTDLIHMEKDNATQEGGVAIDDVLQNLTGGDVNSINTNKNKQQKGQDIVKIIPKELDVNLLEGGNNSNGGNKQKDGVPPGEDDTEEDKNDEGDKKENEDNSSSDEDENSDSDSSSDEDENSDSDSSDDDNTTPINISAHDEYNEFIKHYNDTSKNTNMYGGDANNKRPNKIQIIPMFPYLLRY